MTKPLNNFLETEHVELNKSPMFKGLVQNLKMTPQEQTLINNEPLGGDAYKKGLTNVHQHLQRNL